jgi:pimeloyl-ACP methyl ester carboxylesterase
MPSNYDPRLTIRGDGRPVVLVPGLNGTPELFYRQVPLLERSSCVATYALRDVADSIDTLAADLARIVDSVAPSMPRATIIGESFGGPFFAGECRRCDGPPAVTATLRMAFPQSVGGHRDPRS